MSLTPVKRRWLLTRIVQGFTVTGLGFLTYPFLKSWIPAFSEDTSLDVSLEALAPGESRLVRWRGRNLFVQRRSREMLRSLEGSELALKDPTSLDSSQPAFAANSFRSLRSDVFVTYIGVVVLPIAAQNVLALGVGFGTARACRLSEAGTRAMTFELGVRNTGLAVVLALGFFGDLGGVVLVAALWGLWDVLTGLALATWWRRRQVVAVAVSAEPDPHSGRPAR